MDARLESILQKVERPARYTGAELCAPVIDDKTRIRCCFCVPELYEDAMKKVKPFVTYYMLNDRKGYGCERCFAPWLDMAKQLKKEKYPLFSLETKTPLKNFNLLNFYFDHQYSYTTFLYMLDLAQIPFKSKDRDMSYPLIYGTGICMYNPEPLADFLDFVIIGDQEDVTIRVIDCLVKAKLSKYNKQDTLAALSKIDGVYVPSLSKISYGKNHKIAKIESLPVRRQIVRDLDRAYFPTKLIVPNEHGVLECGLLETKRGCTKGCRYCQEGYINRPVRERRVQTLVAQANAQVYNNGVNKIEIGAPSSEGYSRTPELIKSLNKLCEDRNVQISIKSFRAENLNTKVKNFVNEEWFKYSIEAATENLRSVINKNISNDEIDQTLINAFESGFDKLRLQFMIGLPFEKTQDIIGIVDTIKRIKELYQSHKKSQRNLKIFVEISIFVPKPFTPFQWCSFVGIKEAQKRIAFLTAAFQKLDVDFNFYSPEISEIETILSRGDRRLSQAILYAYLSGSIFDKSTLLFDYEAYNKAFKKLGIDKDLYLLRKTDDEILPWDFINIGVDKNYLLGQLKMSAIGQTTDDCKLRCNKCGLYKMGVCTRGNN